MAFNSPTWSAPHRIDTHYDVKPVIQRWQDANIKGIYVIRDGFDDRTLYVGKVDAGKSVQERLSKHLTGKGSPGIANLVANKQAFIVRWAASRE